MNREIVTEIIGTDMGTDSTNLEKYLYLWEIFEKKMKEKNLNLSSFSKEWELSDYSSSSDYNKFYDKLKKQKSRKNKLIKVQPETVKQIEEYINFLDSFKKFEAFNDEKFGSLFD